MFSFNQKFNESEFLKISESNKFANYIESACREAYSITQNPYVIPLGKFRLSKYNFSESVTSSPCDASEG